ncbi:hypothetical protein MMM2322_02801 [Microbacterium sp. MM2322]
MSVAEVTSRGPDILFAYPQVGVDELVEIVSLSSPKVAFLASEAFDASQFDAPNESLRRIAEDHDGELVSVSLRWAADGLIWEWLATARWHDDLTEEEELAEYQARGIDRVGHELRLVSSRSASQKLLELILEAPAFRGETTNRRTAQAQIVMDAHPNLVADLMFPRDTLKRARAAAAVEVANWESRLTGDEIIDAVVEVLQVSRTIADQKARIAALVRRRADGWALSENFLERLRLEAADRRRRP